MVMHFSIKESDCHNAMRKLPYTYQLLLDTGGNQIQIKNNPDDYSIALLQLNQRLEGEPPDFLTLSSMTGLSKKADMPARQNLFYLNGAIKARNRPDDD